MSVNTKEVNLYSLEDFEIEKEELEVIRGGDQLGSDSGCTQYGNTHTVCDNAGNDVPAPLG